MFQMRIRERKNDAVGSFEFSCDFSKNDSLNKIIDLFGLKKVYLLLYESEDTNESYLMDFCNKGGIENYSSRESSRSWNFALELTMDQLSSFLNAIKATEYDEIEIWDCTTDWQSFISCQHKEPKFFSFRKTSDNELPTSFLLDYSRYKDHLVLIVYNSSRWNEISKKDIEQILAL